MRAIVGRITGRIAVGGLVDFGIHFIDGGRNVASDFLGAFSEGGKAFAEASANSSAAICIVLSGEI